MKQLVLDAWLMERANRRYLQAEAEGDQHVIELMQRYKTTAERAFYRSAEAVKRMSKDSLQAKLTLIKLQGEKQKQDEAIQAVSKRLEKTRDKDGDPGDSFRPGTRRPERGGSDSERGDGSGHGRPPSESP